MNYRTRNLIFMSGLALVLCCGQVNASASAMLASVRVPDGGSTVLLLGSMLVLLEGVRRKFKK